MTLSNLYALYKKTLMYVCMYVCMYANDRAGAFTRQDSCQAADDAAASLTCPEMASEAESQS